ncbi:hypothetical protein [Pseudomonas violetae]|uniref:Uncharacterized protein n=1 Tax=Pseudomonas violetae TaxID=2915813 RepID=A0ABT0ETL4_9PSED|nr:hypothetical protein [Pseudomonas violetae]MCK1788801.1 hypothetical protein [Pseudomonas violetae]
MPLLLKAVTILVLIALLSAVSKRMKRHCQFALGVATLSIGIVLACMVGTATEIVLPGMTGLFAGGLAGALVGGLVFLMLGGIGVVAGGGIGFGLGLWKLVIGGSVVGVFTGTTSLMFGGFGIRTTQIFLVSPFIWLPIILASIGVIRRAMAGQPTATKSSKKTAPSVELLAIADSSQPRT